MLYRVLFILCAIVSLVRAAEPTTAPAGTDPALWQHMLAVNERGAKIKDLTADFEQKKFTPLLKRPLVSSGTVSVVGSAMRWDTAKPEPTAMLINEKEVRLLYPNQKTLEVYPLDQRLGSLA